MAETLVKRLDSAHMKHLYEKALDTTDADFLSSTSEVTLEQVRRLRLESGVRENLKPRMQTSKPPQPPKLLPQPTFSLNSVDFLLDEEDAESWLVATPFHEVKSSPQLQSAPICEEKKEIVGSPVESSVSSELSRGTCTTPASVLDTKVSLSHTGSDTFDGFRVVRPRSVEPGQQALSRERDIRNLPRSTGCITHTPAPPVDITPRPPKAIASKTKTSRIAEDSEKAPVKKSLGSKLKGRISSLGQKESRKTASALPKERPKSIGPVRRNRSSMASPTPPRPKSSMGRTRDVTRCVPKRTTGLRKATSPSPRPGSLARPASSLGTVQEEGKEARRYLGFRKASPAPRPKSSLGGPRVENKPKSSRVTGISRIASPVSRPKSSIGTLRTETITATPTTRRTTGTSRIAQPSPLTAPKVENKEGRSLLRFKKTTSSVPPSTKTTTTMKSLATRGDSRLRPRSVLNKKP